MFPLSKWRKEQTEPYKISWQQQAQRGYWDFPGEEKTQSNAKKLEQSVRNYLAEIQQNKTSWCKMGEKQNITYKMQDVE